LALVDSASSSKGMGCGASRAAHASAASDRATAAEERTALPDPAALSPEEVFAQQEARRARRNEAGTAQLRG